MPTIRDNAVVIRRWDFSETSQTVSLFTHSHGVIRGLAKGAKRENSAFSGGMDLLTRGEIVAIVKPGKDLATFTAWHLQDSYRSLRQDQQANRLSLYLADVVHHMILDQDLHPQVFESFTVALGQLADPSRREAAVLQVQWVLLSESGYTPQLDHDAQTGQALPHEQLTLTFSPAAGGVLDASNPAAASGWRVRRQTVDILRSLARSQTVPANASSDSLRRANRLLAAYLREIIGREPPTLRWAFPDLNG